MNVVDAFVKMYSTPYRLSEVDTLTGIPMTLTSHCLFSWRAPSWMIGGVLCTTLAFHILSSVKYAYSAYYETIAEIIQCCRRIKLCRAVDVQILSSVKLSRVVIVIGSIFLFKWFWFNFLWPHFYHVDFRHVFPSKLW